MSRFWILHPAISSSLSSLFLIIFDRWSFKAHSFSPSLTVPVSLITCCYRIVMSFSVPYFLLFFPIPRLSIAYSACLTVSVSLLFFLLPSPYLCPQQSSLTSTSSFLSFIDFFILSMSAPLSPPRWYSSTTPHFSTSFLHPSFLPLLLLLHPHALNLLSSSSLLPSFPPFIRSPCRRAKLAYLHYISQFFLFFLITAILLTTSLKN